MSGCSACLQSPDPATGEAQAVPGVLVLRPESPLFFANADGIFAAIRTHIDSANALGAVVVSLEESADFDSTSIETLAEFADYLHQRGLRLGRTRVKDDMRDVLRRANFPLLPPSCYATWSVDDAVREALR